MSLHRSTPVRELAGLAMGLYRAQRRRPSCRSMRPLPGPPGFREIVKSEVPCNWLQCQENSCDPVHFEWMHDNWNIRQRGELGPYAAAIPSESGFPDLNSITASSIKPRAG